MTTDVRITRPDASIQEAARMMRECDAGSIPVGDNDRLVGMITDRDIAIRAVAEGRSFDTPVREVMSGHIEYVFEDQDLREVSSKMSDLKVRRLPVLNRNKRLVGIVSLGDMSKSGDPAQAHAALAGSARPGGPHTQA
jgi:CBS domain-containing protein